ncbi:MAG TPA: hypothetical protein VFI43_05570 [Nitrosospira sp.]|nr:hypothetical protein [Nitrosospira sp.]
MRPSSALIILGMHRSGTSLLAGLLSQVGVVMGKRLYAPQKGVNEKGFWEHEDIVDTHDELLLMLNSQWDDVLPWPEKWWESEAVQPFIARLLAYVRRDFSNADVWALKDPRMCRLLPLWLPILTREPIRPVFICMNRNPFEVVGSLQKRDGFSREKGLVLWLNHALSAERYSRGYSRVFTDFDQVVKKPSEVLLKIEKEADIVFPKPVDTAAGEIGRFVSPDLRHHKADTPPNDGHEELALMADKLYRHLVKMSGGDETQYELIDKIAADFLAYQNKWNPELIEQIHYLNQERADYRVKFFRIYKSWSWQLAKPVWLIEKMLRKY